MAVVTITAAKEDVRGSRIKDNETCTGLLLLNQKAMVSYIKLLKTFRCWPEQLLLLFKHFALWDTVTLVHPQDLKDRDFENQMTDFF